MRSTESRFKNAVFVLAAIVVLAAKTSYLRQVFKGEANDSFYGFGHGQLGIFVIFKASTGTHDLESLNIRTLPKLLVSTFSARAFRLTS